VSRLDRGFFDRPTLVVARELIGKVLVHRRGASETAGAIVEVEAYIGEDDPACHAAPGPTARNAPLYGPPGLAYVYLNYGIHHLFNVVTEPEGRPAAVLVRALAPLDGLDLMRRRRAADRRPGAPMPDHDLCRGPGALSHAMGITLAQNRVDLCAPAGRPVLTIEDRGIAFPDVEWSGRIGIRAGTERPWRCSVSGCAAVSGSRRRASSRAALPA
jgi:DNA-3-methyladenine glycosylase